MIPDLHNTRRFIRHRSPEYPICSTFILSLTLQKCFPLGLSRFSIFFLFHQEAFHSARGSTRLHKERYLSMYRLLFQSGMLSTTIIYISVLHFNPMIQYGVFESASPAHDRSIFLYHSESGRQRGNEPLRTRIQDRSLGKEERLLHRRAIDGQTRTQDTCGALGSMVKQLDRVFARIARQFHHLIEQERFLCV